MADRLRHPRAVRDQRPPAKVDVDGTTVAVDEDGWFDVPDAASGRWPQQLADAHDVALEDLTPDESDDEAEAESTTSDGVEAPVDPSEYTVTELRDHLDSTDYSDAELEALAEAERAGDARTTALDAVEDALEA